ncbi:hypothetical protein [Streptomyces sp. NPDC046727]|uniref:hypothetical protein n=1 Tax=Streptomyces sp. NPDC046727 TaxID=3155373 RepID=UPI0033DD97E3
MRPTDDFVVELVDRLRDRARDGRLLPAGVGLNVNHPVLGADGTGPARGAEVTTQDPRPVLAYDYTGNGDGTWKVGVGVVDTPVRPGSDIAAVTAGRISVSPITPAGTRTASTTPARRPC